jgi:hypothetical protein
MHEHVTREMVTELLETDLSASSWTTATGFTASMDLLVPGGKALTDQMRAWQANGTASARTVWTDILDAHARSEATGCGSELVVEPASELDRLLEWATAMTFGGTGVRAAAQAARLGHPSVASIPMADSRLRGIVASPLVSLVPTTPGHLGTSVPTHVIIELPLRSPGRATSRHRASPARNRLIVRGPEEFSPLMPVSFIERMRAAVPPVRSVLISGFNTYTTATALEQALAAAIRWIAMARDVLPAAWLYLELAGYIAADALRRTVAVLGPVVDAVGMNEDECAMALARETTMAAPAPAATFASLRDLLRHYGLSRLVVHGARMSAYMAPTPIVSVERQAVTRALALANTAAGYRYAQGCDGTLAQLREAARDWLLSPRGMAHAVAGADREDLVIVPAWDITRGVGTIGLGDSFTGAFLAGLPPASTTPDNAHFSPEKRGARTRASPVA